MVKEIPLTKGYVTVVDDKNYNYLMQWKWCVRIPNSSSNCVKPYAIRNLSVDERSLGMRHQIHMHRIIAQAPDNMQVDHINGNTLDNRECNLRLCNNQENSRNQVKKVTANITSLYKGVRKNHMSKWGASIVVNHRNICIGYYHTEEMAALMYNKKAIEIFKEFAKLNVLDMPENIIIDNENKIAKDSKTSRYRGVYWHKSSNNWMARIFHIKYYYIGCFDNEVDAALAYDEKAIELLGDKAKCNLVKVQA